MVKLTKPIADPTIEAIDRAIEYRASLEKARPYLGMSALGEECERKLWYGFRHVRQEPRSAYLIKAAEDGHRTEDLIADRLRLVEGVMVWTVDPDTGQQFAYSDLGGHLRGHSDGVILGIIQAPRTPHVWENKAREPKYLAQLDKLKADLGEKNALRAWSPTYFAQGQLYMHYAGLTRHYLTCASPGGREMTSVRTDYDPAFALKLIGKARRIITAQEPPAKAWSADYYQCRWCPFSGQCHRGEWAERNCRTCLHATPMDDGTWHCARWEFHPDVEMQRQGCPTHLLIPALVPGQVVEATDHSVTYRLTDGSEFIDSEHV